MREGVRQILVDLERETCKARKSTGCNFVGGCSGTLGSKRTGVKGAL